jgi:hypothetical protein
MYNYKLVQTLFSSSNKLSKSLGSLLADNTLSLQIIDALYHDMHDIEWWVYLLDWREFYAKLLKNIQQTQK